MAFSYHWSREEQRKWAEERLFRYLRTYVDRFHPYYRRLFAEQGIDVKQICSYDDFTRIPLTCRGDIQDRPEEFVLRYDPAGADVEKLPGLKKLEYAARAYTTHYLRDVYGQPRSFKEKVEQAAMYEWLPAHFNFSGGASGPSTSSAFTASDLRRNVRQVQGMLYATGWEPGLRTLNLFPALPHLDFFTFITAARGVDQGGSLLHACGSEAIPVRRQVEMASSLGMKAIVSPPGYLLYWLKTAMELKEEGIIEGLPGIELVVAGGEALADGCRQRIKEYLAGLGSPDVRLVEYYGMTEMKASFFECDEKMGVHLNPEFYYWEVLDPETEKPVKWGEAGVLVFSHIDWRGTALLRYWTGDLVSGGMVWERCPCCGLTLPRVFTPIIRAEEDFTDFRGSRVMLPALAAALHGVEELESFQVALEKGKHQEGDEPGTPPADRVVVYARAAAGVGEAAVRKGIQHAMERELGFEPDEVVFPGADALEERLFGRTGWKTEWVVDERNDAEPVS